MIFPLLFLLVGVGLVFGLLHYLGDKEHPAIIPPVPAKTTYVNPGTASSTVRKILDDESPQPAVPDPTLISPAPPPGNGPKPAPVDPLLPPGANGSAPLPESPAADPSGEEFHIIGKFLDAKTLEERLPLMETKLSNGELAATILAGPLPERLSIEPGVRLSNSIENLTDCFYAVTLAGKTPGGDTYTVLVRRRADQAPRVLAEPFLDLIGGRLAAFAAAPNDDMKTFQVIVVPSPYSEDGKVPNADKKITLRLDGSETGHPIAIAYTSNASKISETLKDPTAGLLRYGSPKPCTIVMEWNRREDPKKPYLEVVDIKAFTWNP